MRGYDDHYTDIVDYIVGITDDIWMNRAVGRVRDTYAEDCVVYSAAGVVHGIDAIVASTLAGINAAPDGDIRHLNVAWSGDEDTGFYTAHLGQGRSTNSGASPYGPATGRRVTVTFAADCIGSDNKIHTEWLVRDNGAFVRQLGFDVQAAAQVVAAGPSFARYDLPADQLEPADPASVEGWVAAMFETLWGAKRFDRLSDFYAPTAIVHGAGQRTAIGLRAIGQLYIHALAALPDAGFQLGHVSWSDEADGVIVAARWSLRGQTRPGGVLGACPAGKDVFLIGISHMRFAGGKVVEEWMMFDEVGVLAQAYAQ